LGSLIGARNDPPKKDKCYLEILRENNTLQAFTGRIGKPPNPAKTDAIFKLLAGCRAEKEIYGRN
jgi:hypothetical protein